MQIWMRFEAIECKFQPFERDSNYSNANSNIPMQIRTIWTRFEAIKLNFKPF